MYQKNNSVRVVYSEENARKMEELGYKVFYSFQSPHKQGQKIFFFQNKAGFDREFRKLIRGEDKIKQG